MRFFLRNRGKWRQDQRYCFSYNKQTIDPHKNFLIAFTSEAPTTNIQAPEKLKPQIQPAAALVLVIGALFGAWDLGLSATSRWDASRQNRGVGGKRFASAAPICRCNDRMALYPVEARQ